MLVLGSVFPELSVLTTFSVPGSVFPEPTALFPSAGLGFSAVICGAAAGVTAVFVCGGVCVALVVAGLSVTGVAGIFSWFAGCVTLLPMSLCWLVLSAGDGFLLPSVSGFVWASLPLAGVSWALVFRFCPEERLRPPRRPRLDPRFC